MTWLRKWYHRVSDKLAFATERRKHDACIPTSVRQEQLGDASHHREYPRTPLLTRNCAERRQLLHANIFRFYPPSEKNESKIIERKRRKRWSKNDTSSLRRKTYINRQSPYSFKSASAQHSCFIRQQTLEKKNQQPKNQENDRKTEQTNTTPLENLRRRCNNWKLEGQRGGYKMKWPVVQRKHTRLYYRGPVGIKKRGKNESG